MRRETADEFSARRSIRCSGLLGFSTATVLLPRAASSTSRFDPYFSHVEVVECKAMDGFSGRGLQLFSDAKVGAKSEEVAEIFVHKNVVNNVTTFIPRTAPRVLEFSKL